MLTSIQKKQFEEKGYVILENLFSFDEISPIIKYTELVLSEVANKLYEDGFITNKYENLDYTQRLIAINNEYPEAAVITTLQRKMGKPIFDFWHNEKYIKIAQQLLGKDIDGHPFWALRSQAPHEKLLTVPWHQDAAYLKDGASPTLIFWTPLTNVTKQSGCLEIIPAKKNGREDKLYKHKIQSKENGFEKSWYLEVDDDIDVSNIITCEINIGSVLLFNESIIHRSLSNTSSNTRWSLDIRYMKNNQFTGTNQKSIPLIRENTFTEEEKNTRNNFINNTVSNIPEPDYPTNFRKNMWWLDRWESKES